jgi:chitinase
MTYDFHGTWESVTNFHSPLYASSSDPSSPPLNTTFNTHSTVQGYLAAGVPATKLVMGVPFYGRGWTNVPNVNNGLYQSGSAAPGTYEAGIEDYKVLKNKGYPGYRHPEAEAYWIFDGSTFWTFDDPVSMANKMGYIGTAGLAGAMFWELSGDTSDGELITVIANGLP